MGFMGFDVKEQKAAVQNQGDVPFSTTTMPTIALAVKNAMLVPEKTANQYLYIDSFTVSLNQILASLEKATGKKWEKTHLDAEEQKKIGLEKLSKGDLSGGMLLIRYIVGVQGYGGDYALYEKTANELLSLPKESLDEETAKLVKA